MSLCIQEQELIQDVLTAAPGVNIQYSSTLNKMVYLEHRAFLPCIDNLIQDIENFPHRRAPLASPESKTMAYVQEAIGRSISAKKT